MPATVVVGRSCFHKRVSRILSTRGVCGIHAPWASPPAPQGMHALQECMPPWAHMPPCMHTLGMHTPRHAHSHACMFPHACMPPGTHTPWAQTSPSHTRMHMSPACMPPGMHTHHPLGMHTHPQACTPPLVDTMRCGQ